MTTTTTNIIKEEWLTGTEGGLCTTTKSSSRWTMLTASPITGLSCLRSRFFILFRSFHFFFFLNWTVCLSIAIQSAGRKQNNTQSTTTWLERRHVSRFRLWYVYRAISLSCRFEFLFVFKFARIIDVWNFNELTSVIATSQLNSLLKLIQKK